MNSARQMHTATLLRDGRVLVAAGHYFGAISDAEIYNYWTETWTPTGSLNTARFYASANLLEDGSVLVAGGKYEWSSSSNLASVELYNPITGTWSTIAPLTVPHAAHTSTLLLDGRILIAGGYSESWQSSSDTQIYDPNLGFEAAWQPVILSSSEPSEGGILTLTGAGLRGYQYTEAAGGGTYTTSTNVPVVQLRRLDNGLIKWVRPSGFTAEDYTSFPLWGWQPGPTLVTVFVNGIPSESRMIYGGDMLLRLYLPALMK